jgi:hypothetical protein
MSQICIHLCQVKYIIHISIPSSNMNITRDIFHLRPVTGKNDK